MATFFVSYNQADRPWAEWIAWQLEGAGYEAFIQAWDIRPGSNFVLAMQTATEKADRTVAVLSPDYLKSKFTQPEWSASFVQDPTGEHGLLIPVRVKEVDLRGMWVAIVYIDLVGLPEEEAKQALLNGIAQGRAKPSVVPFPGDATTPVPSPQAPAVLATGEPQYPVTGPFATNQFANWGALDASETDDGGLAFSFRLESTRVTELNVVQLSVDQRELVDKLLEQGSTTTVTHNFPAALFELLIPNHLKEFLKRSTRLRLLVNKNTARYPWELLSEPPHTSVASSCTSRHGLIRDYFTKYRRVTDEGMTPPSALVVGDPMVKTYPKVPGAAFESLAVSNAIRKQGLKVHTLTGADAREIIGALFAERYRIVHIVARASYRGQIPGLILSDGLFLTPLEFEQMEILPALVFINFGHLGALQADPPYEAHGRSLGMIAAAFAEALISQGLRALIVSGSAVDAAACTTFTTTIYNSLLLGETFGVAVQKARQLTHESHIGVTTWGAFHCYGAPDFRIVEPAAKDEPILLASSLYEHGR